MIFYIPIAVIFGLSDKLLLQIGQDEVIASQVRLYLATYSPGILLMGLNDL